MGTAKKKLYFDLGKELIKALAKERWKSLDMSVMYAGWLNSYKNAILKQSPVCAITKVSNAESSIEINKSCCCCCLHQLMLSKQTLENACRIEGKFKLDQLTQIITCDWHL